MNTDTTIPDARRIAHRRVGGAATAAFLALLLLGALHQSADADTATPTATPSQSRPQQVQPPADGGFGRHHRGFDGGGSGAAPSAPSAPSSPSSGSTLDGSTT